MTTYYSDVLSEIAPITGKDIVKYVPENNNSLLLQYLYHYRNPKILKEKDHFVYTGDYDSYAVVHERYHPFLINLRDQLKARDIYIVAPATGDVVYSANKGIDFAVNLYNGNLNRTALSDAFRVAVSNNSKSMYYIDFTSYAGALDKPVFFLSSPIYFFDELVAVLILQFDSEVVNDLLYDEYLLSTNGTLEYTVIGEDLFLRNSSREFLSDKEKYLSDMMNRNRRKGFKKAFVCEKLDDMSMVVQYPSDEKEKLLKEQVSHILDYKKEKVLIYSKKIDIIGMDWYLITKINQKEAFGNFFKRTYYALIVIIVLLAIIFILGRNLGEVISQRIKKLYYALVQLYNGEKSTELSPGIQDELGDTIEAYNKLKTRINEASTFAIEMSEGNFSHEFHTLSEKDDLGNSLNTLKENMIQSRNENEQRAQEDEIRNWINTGVAEFNNLLRQNNDNLKELAFSIVENLVKYLDANLGGIFLVEGEKDKKINLVAAYAYDRRKYNQKSVEIGEGLLGNVYLEKMPVYLKEIPEDYIEITSGLGSSVPKCLYISPLKIDDDVLGLIEIASLNEIEEKHIEFITKVSESIAATFVSVRLNMQTSVLLEESNRRAEENAQQEEEMRQNMEEMQATQEELARLRQDDEKRTKDMQLIVDNTRKMLREMLDSIPGGYVLKDQNGVVHLINKEGAELYKLPVEKIIGKTDHELLDAKIYEKEHEKDIKTIEEGEQEYTEELDVGGNKRKFKVIKRPFQIDEINQMGILTIRYIEK
jgi:PAS domain S-box-containing protein